MRRAWFRWCGVPSFIAAPCRRFVAVAEKAEKATVTIFDLTSTNLKKKRPLTCQECLSREYAPFAWALGSTANLMVSCLLGRQVRFACVLSRCKVFDGSRRWSRLDACHLDLGEEPAKGAPWATPRQPSPTGSCATLSSRWRPALRSRWCHGPCRTFVPAQNTEARVR